MDAVIAKIRELHDKLIMEEPNMIRVTKQGIFGVSTYYEADSFNFVRDTSLNKEKLYIYKGKETVVVILDTSTVYEVKKLTDAEVDEYRMKKSLSID